ncbi:hypothetical protein K440DRAFT_621703 [Wilcoxina mikolae CBS 423.85]|nr:hypothetical protein K440DRAFT_621703 [Wilcoxina mikolae CBS 423.85]
MSPSAPASTVPSLSHPYRHFTIFVNTPSTTSSSTTTTFFSCPASPPLSSFLARLSEIAFCILTARKIESHTHTGGDRTTTTMTSTNRLK